MRAMAGLSAKRGILYGAGVGFVAAAGLLLYLLLRNPIIVDSVRLALLFVVLPTGAMFALLGGLAGLVRALARRNRGTGDLRPCHPKAPSDPALGDSSRSGRRTPRPVRFALVALVFAGSVCISGGVTSAIAQRGPAKPNLKLLMVGVDGATWRVASSMMKRGELPNLSKTVASGSAGVLESVRPMYSTRIFTSIATGKTADKHGVRGLSETRADDVLVKRIWNILHEQMGWDYGTVEWFLTWPPSTSEHGFSIPDMLAETAETIPPELSFVRELRDIGKSVSGGSYGRLIGIAHRAAVCGCRISTLAELADIVLAMRSSPQLELYAREQEALVRVISDATCREMRLTDVEMVALLYKSTDSISHKYWRYHDPRLFPGTDAASIDRYHSEVEDIYRTVDSELGRLLSHLAPDGILLVFSDHGFQPSKTINSTPAAFKVESLLTRLGFSLSDIGYITVGGVFYLRPLTIDETESTRLLSRLEEVFASLAIEDSGEPAFSVDVSDAAGTGDDYVLVAMNASAIESSVASEPLIVSPSGDSLRLSEFLTNMDISGSHAMDGIIIASGPPFRRGNHLEGASVLDITPTVLAALGLPVAEDMDGRVLTEAMTRTFLAECPVTTIATYETEVRAPRRSRGVQKMPEETKQRLRSLGYMQ
ncbi:MAG: hypothetical protein GF400_03135 [Candidatus Eisenbacteria bacterium]|nr:hypothetical protein [Candidatus Eisenbacteria bacterium]